MKINRLLLDGIPLTTYDNENGQVKKLIYFFHGFTGNKDANIMGRGEILAEMGYYVVALDAYLHGERMSELEKKRSNVSKYEDIIEIVMHTAKDASRLFDKYFKYQANIVNDNYLAYGVSMGSLTAFYLGTIDKRLKTIIGLVPTPSFIDYYKDKARMYNFDHGFYFERKIAFYENHCPTNNYELLADKKIFMGCGLHDEIVYPKYAIKLNELLPTSIIKFYETGHISTPEMLEDSYKFLREAN